MAESANYLQVLRSCSFSLSIMMAPFSYWIRCGLKAMQTCLACSSFSILDRRNRKGVVAGPQNYWLPAPLRGNTCILIWKVTTSPISNAADASPFRCILCNSHTPWATALTFSPFSVCFLSSDFLTTFVCILSPANSALLVLPSTRTTTLSSRVAAQPQTRLLANSAPSPQPSWLLPTTAPSPLAHTQMRLSYAGEMCSPTRTQMAARSTSSMQRIRRS